MLKDIIIKIKFHLYVIIISKYIKETWFVSNETEAIINISFFWEYIFHIF